MQEYYKILGLNTNASLEEVEKAYKELKEKYSRERFYEGEVGNEAARNLTKVETAYQEIVMSHKKLDEDNQEVNDYAEVEKLLKNGRITAAQEKLDNFSNRNAEWHYLQAVVFYKKNWFNESKKQLEIALTMDPHNSKYNDSFSKLKDKMDFNDRQYRGDYTSRNTTNPQNDRQMGGADPDGCLTFCATWCCMDMLCSMCCR